MTDKYFPSDYDELTTLASADKLAVIDASESIDSRKLKWSYYSTLLTDIVRDAGIFFGHTPAGYLFNGYLDVSVSSGDITVAVKTLSGSNPSATDPVYVRIGDVEHELTAALSVTISAGTNTFNSGSSELATHAVPYWVYLGYNSTDGVVIGVARFPYATVYSDFSITATNEKYCAISTITSAGASDVYQMVGYFEATLSAGAGYTWSSPTNIKSWPITQSGLMTYTPTPSASGSMTWTSVTIGRADYIINGRNIDITVRGNGTTGGTASNALYYTVPFGTTDTSNAPLGYGTVVDNASAPTPARVTIGSGTPQIIQTYKADNSNFALAAGKTSNIHIAYDI